MVDSNKTKKPTKRRSRKKHVVLTDRKRQILIDMRDEFRRYGWTNTANLIDQVLSD